MRTIVYGGERLFASGPTWLEGPTTQWRHARQGVAGGERLVGDGLEGRELMQGGTLTADTREALAEQMKRIEQKVDGVGRELVNDAGERWERAVVLAFKPGRVERLGRRWKVEYTVRYGLDV